MKHKRSALLLLLSVSALAAPPDPEDVPDWHPVQVAHELMALPEQKIVVSEVALRLSELVDSRTDVAKGRAAIGALAERVKLVVGSRVDPQSRVQALNTVLFKEQGFRYDATDPMGHNSNNRHLWGLLSRKKGNCVTLPVLWYSVAEQLGYPVFLVAAPQHLFVRYDDGKLFANIEATSGGGIFQDDSIIRELEIPDAAIRSGSMMKSMSKHEAVANLVMETANLYAGDSNLGIALAMYNFVLGDNPKNMQAHSNAALMQTALVGMLQSATPRGPSQQREIDFEIQSRTKNALSHARSATALGAVPPLKEGYWKVPTKRGQPEAKTVTKSPAPFDLESHLRIGASPVLIRDREGLLPTAMQAMRFGFTSQGAFLNECARICGPAPEVCAQMSRYFP